MIFINNALQKIGKDCLIVGLKSKNFFEGNGLRKEDFEQLFEVLKYDQNINLPPSKKNNLLLCVLYYEYDDNEEARQMLKQKLSNSQSLGQGGTFEDILHLIFNEIEPQIIHVKIICSYSDDDQLELSNEVTIIPIELAID